MDEKWAAARELHQVLTAIKAAKRLGSKPSKRLLRYRVALGRLREWERKKKLAGTKLKKYQQIVKRYRKVFGEGHG